ncbi:hypothetical protein MFMK1_001063 [Metallumcola ferriviriculae]|uniref:Uncharacterized protein n=1 Tax=Metallumcola ferriviriculae TaxID=3039180 RepID=A0AAU0UM35_9FIRM|nr:hypothetical protein MFMK1_001063 [Desulfitibacteraceae bacterium MK1]
MVKKFLLLLLVFYLLIWGLNKTAIETRKVTAVAPGAVMSINFTPQDLEVEAMGNLYQLKFPPPVQLRINQYQQIVGSWYTTAKEYWQRLKARVGRLIDGAATFAAVVGMV